MTITGSNGSRREVVISCPIESSASRDKLRKFAHLYARANNLARSGQTFEAPLDREGDVVPGTFYGACGCLLTCYINTAQVDA